MQRLSRQIAFVTAAILAFSGFSASQARAEGPIRIRFSDYFVGQNTYRPGFYLQPDLHLSPRVKALQGRQVELLAYMAEVLPSDGSYFLAIREPGGECPFCSQSFDWSAITVVFVKKGISLVYLGGPIRIRGRLDVGKRADETGLESYVRIYDAEVSRYQP